MWSSIYDTLIAVLTVTHNTLDNTLIWTLIWLYGHLYGHMIVTNYNEYQNKS